MRIARYMHGLMIMDLGECGLQLEYQIALHVLISWELWQDFNGLAELRGHGLILSQEPVQPYMLHADR